MLVVFMRLFDLRLFDFVCFLSSWCLGRAAVCDCDTPWTFLLPFLHTWPVVFVPCGPLGSLPVHSYNDVIISVARVSSLESTFVYPFLLILFIPH